MVRCRLPERLQLIQVVLHVRLVHPLPIVADVASPPDQTPGVDQLLALQAQRGNLESQVELVSNDVVVAGVQVSQGEKVDQGGRVQRLVPEEAGHAILENLVHRLLPLRN